MRINFPVDRPSRMRGKILVLVSFVAACSSGLGSRDESPTDPDAGDAGIQPSVDAAPDTSSAFGEGPTNPTCAPLADTCNGGEGVVYRCDDPRRGTPENVDGKAMQNCTDLDDDPATKQHRMCCPVPACVRLETGDKNCSSTHGRWFACPGGPAPDYRSTIGPPANSCKFFTSEDGIALYCCS